MKFLISLLSSLILLTSIHAQSGCTDPQAVNYDSSATENDGSCEYALTEYPPVEIATLPMTLSECSGLAWLPGGLWIHNDSGNDDNIFRIDTTTGAVLQTVIIATADNNDWEELASDDQYLYIGDFGNNPGNRTDLNILRVDQDDLGAVAVNAEIISFVYSDQTDFTENMNNHNFDCEAMFVHNDSIHLFTKNWADNQTKHYVLPAIPGAHTAELVETFDVELLVTGADISDQGVVSLIGYNSIGFSFMWLLFDYEESFFFSGNKRRIALGFGLDTGQTEGIVFRENGYGYICSERFEAGPVLTPQKLMSFESSQWTGFYTNTNQLDLGYDFLILPNPVSTDLNIQLSLPVDRWQIYDIQGQLIRSGNTTSFTPVIHIDLNELSSGQYFFQIIKDGKSMTKAFVKQ